MQRTPLSAADQAEIDKRLNFMDAKDIAMFVIDFVFHIIELLMELLKCALENVFILSCQKISIRKKRNVYQIVQEDIWQW